MQREVASSGSQCDPQCGEKTSPEPSTTTLQCIWGGCSKAGLFVKAGEKNAALCLSLL